MKFDKSYGAAIAAFLIWGFIPLPLRALDAFTSVQILFFRILFSVLLLLLILSTARRKQVREIILAYKTGSKTDRRKLVLMTAAGSILLTGNWLLYIYVVNHVAIQTASFAYLLCPILTAVFGFLLLKEQLRGNQWLAIGLSLVSCILIGIGEVTHLLFSILIAASYALYLITQRVLKAYDKMVLLAFQLMLSFAMILLFYLFSPTQNTVKPDAHFFGMMFILSAVFTVLPLFLNLYALKELKSGTIGILMYLNPIINFLLAFWFFNEEATALHLVAYAVIFCSIILYNLNFKARPAIIKR